MNPQYFRLPSLSVRELTPDWRTTDSQAWSCTFDSKSSTSPSSPLNKYLSMEALSNNWGSRHLLLKIQRTVLIGKEMLNSAFPKSIAWNSWSILHIQPQTVGSLSCSCWPACIIAHEDYPCPTKKYIFHGQIYNSYAMQMEDILSFDFWTVY